MPHLRSIGERLCGNDSQHNQTLYLNVAFGHNENREERNTVCKRKGHGTKTERFKILAVLKRIKSAAQEKILARS